MKTKKYMVRGEELTITETRVIILDLYCFARKDVANYLDRSPSTVETHIRNIHRKFKLKGQRELHRFAFENGFYNDGFFQGEFLFNGFDDLPFPREDVA